MKKSLYIFLLFVLFTAVSCIKDEQAYTTFTGDMVYSYLQKDTSYSEFVRVLDKAGLKGMLSAYGQYTCLVPTNGAMRDYYVSYNSRYNFDSLRQGQIDSLAKAHIMGNRYHTYELSNGVMPNMNMNYHYVEVQFDSLVGGIRLNGSSRIVSKNNDVYNGVIHSINRVLKVLPSQLPLVMKENKNISIFTDALTLTHLADSLTLVRDGNYSPTKVFNYDDFPLGIATNPWQRLYGYTAFVEDNALLKSKGINSLSDLILRAKQLYPGNSAYDDDYTHRNNSLNKYIAYHLINKAIYNNRFYYSRNAIKGYTPDEFLETMLENRIIRVSNVNAQVTLNAGSNSTVHVLQADNQRALNGIYHLLDNMLVYTPNVEHMLQNTRIRFDIASLSPELTNNNIRGIETNLYTGFELGYLKNIKMRQHTLLVYSVGLALDNYSYPRFQSDCFYASGYYDFTIRLLPIPPGTYELRLGSSMQTNFPTQIYVDNKPIGIPEILPLRAFSLNYKLDANTDDNGIKNDQELRNIGYMKAPNTYLVMDAHDVIFPARDYNMCYRKIIGIFTFTEYQAHTVRFKSVASGDGNVLLDYFEFVPKIIFSPPADEKEGRD